MHTSADTIIWKENARRGLLQMDDRILLYNYGGDYQENNTTTIDPDAALWTQVLV